MNKVTNEQFEITELNETIIPQGTPIKVIDIIKKPTSSGYAAWCEIKLSDDMTITTTIDVGFIVRRV